MFFIAQHFKYRNTILKNSKYTLCVMNKPMSGDLLMGEMSVFSLDFVQTLQQTLRVLRYDS